MIRLLRHSGDVSERWIAARWIMTSTGYRHLGGLRLPTGVTIRWRLGKSEFGQVHTCIESAAFTAAAAQP